MTHFVDTVPDTPLCQAAWRELDRQREALSAALYELANTVLKSPFEPSPSPYESDHYPYAWQARDMARMVRVATTNRLDDLLLQAAHLDRLIAAENARRAALTG